MPLYEYECESCGRVTEALQKFSDGPLTTCAHCSGKLHRIMSQSTFHLKGTGWYVTDYANRKTHSPQSSNPPANTTSKKESESKPSGGSENKSE